MPTDQERIKELEARVAMYERNGAAKLFYALNRKMNEMADMLNKQTLSNLDLSEPKDKTFDRLKVIWSDAASIAVAVESLGKISGVTNDEIADTSKPIFKRPISAESMADSVGELAGQRTT